MNTPLSLKSLIKAGGHVSGFLRQASPFHSLVSDAEAKGEKPGKADAPGLNNFQDDSAFLPVLAHNPHTENENPRQQVATPQR